VERTNSAVSKTAGMTVEKEREVSKKYVSPPKRSPPRYSQFWVRRLNASNSHHTGAEHANRSAKSLGERARMEVPRRRSTSASTRSA
jgi:hypothetical protein